MRVVLAGDHAGLEMRQHLASIATSLGHEVMLVGPVEGERVDFPIAAKALCGEIMAGRAHRGILLCGSGAGMTMAANRFPGIRAATAHDTYTAHQMVEHDAANVLTLGTRVIGSESAGEIVRAFLSADFQPVDRYRRRLQQIIDIERDRTMNPLHELTSAGQAVWLDYIRRDILDDGTLAKYIANLCVTGLTSNPSIFDKAISGSELYDEAIEGDDAESIFFDLAIDDLGRAADLLRTAWDVSNGTDGCVSLEVSPLLAADAATTIEQGVALFARAGRPNLMIKVPGTPEAPEAVEELVFRGVNVNITLLFDDVQYRRAAEAYIRGIERRLEAGLDANVFSVASVFVSRWDTPTADQVGEAFANRLGIACATQCHRSCEEIFGSDRFKAIEAKGGHRQKLLMASTSTKDPSLPDTLYVQALAARDSINTIPEATLLAFADHGTVDHVLGADDWAEADRVIAGCEAAGVDVRGLAEKLQAEGAEAFVKSWRNLLQTIDTKLGNLAAH
ncbi:MAG: transaldolase [Phycisphaerales bacterium]|jgi:transaldolase|nr:transaldolase [Phycisphaerales bacterium]